MSLHVHELVKRFDRRSPAVLDGVTFRAPPGSFTCLLGRSGVGKSTVLGVVAGLVAADSGQVSVGGRVLDGLPPHRRPVTLLMQQPQLFPFLTVMDNVAFGLRVRGARRAARRRRAVELLTLVGLGALADRSPHQLSGGEQQRVALARALAVGPELLLADEPFANVDAPVRRELQDLVVDLHRRLGTTVVLVTHDVGEALALGDQLVVLEQGRVQDCGPPRVLYERPSSGHTARLLGFANELTGTVEAGALRVGGWCVAVAAANARGPLDAARPSTWVVRPERVRLGPAEPGAVTGTVATLRYHGRAVEARILAGPIALVAHVEPSAGLAIGDTVSVHLRPEDLVEVAHERPRATPPAT